MTDKPSLREERSPWSTEASEMQADRKGSKKKRQRSDEIILTELFFSPYSKTSPRNITPRQIMAARKDPQTDPLVSHITSRHTNHQTSHLFSHIKSTASSMSTNHERGEWLTFLHRSHFDYIFRLNPVFMRDHVTRCADLCQW